jgi:hypothetical protein
MIHLWSTLMASNGGASFIVLTLGDRRVEIRIDGEPLVSRPPRPCSEPPAAEPAQASLARGRRYVDPPSGLTLYCTDSGPGRLSADGRPMVEERVRPWWTLDAG